MKFLALVSGGKDSCMNILHCIQQGHELVALINLYPKPSGPEEIDSYMFQTVGSRAIENLATCLDKPLYRELISEDEDAVVDTLVTVFRRVLEDFPDIEAVSVGAIGSVYQQLRVDTACQKVGLVSLTFLWQRDQIELLDEIIASGLDARIIKVAGIGLDESHLGKSLAECRPHLLRLHQLYGLHPCGEGGEYETMVFDGPNFHRRLVMVGEKTVKHANDDVYYLSFDTVTEPKEPCAFELPIPQLLSDKFDLNIRAPGPVIPVQNTGLWKRSPWQAKLFSDDTFQFTAAGESEQVFADLAEFYSTQNLSLDHTRHVSVIVSDMRQFVQFNKRYIEFFNVLNPPSRACVEAPIEFEVEITVFGTTSVDLASKCLHVQGRSFWAPANIGPYSQSRMEYGLNYVAGQIGLEPATLALVADPVRQALLALQNAYRVLDTMHGEDNWQVFSATVFVTNETFLGMVNEIWQNIHGDGVPLVVAQVSRLPRGAVVEWALQTFDIKYFEYQSTLDETDLFVWPAKSVIDEFKLQFGLHTLQLTFDDLEAPQEAKYATIYTTTPGKISAPCAQVIPARNLWVNTESRSSVVQTLI